MRRTPWIVAVAAALGLIGPAGAEGTLTGGPALVIAHRGASGTLPEHTLEAYRLAVAQGADFIEPDLVATKDGVLVVRHEPMLGGTTDVADRPEFAARRTTRTMDGADVTDWFASDFTLAEIKTLRARQSMPDRDPSKNGQFAIPTLHEVIDLAKAESARTGRTIGIYPETKHPTYHAALGLALEDRLLDLLNAAGWTDKASPVIVQSFETGNLKELRRRTGVRLAQLVGGGADRPFDLVASGDRRTYRDLVTPEGLREIAAYADGVAPAKPHLLPMVTVDRNGDGRPDDLNGDGRSDARDRILGEPTGLVKDAHAAGLFVHTWTFRSEPRWLAAPFAGDPQAEYKAFYALGVDGVFSDFPDAAAKAR